MSTPPVSEPPAPDPDPDTPAGEEVEEAPPLQFPTLEVFVEELIAVVYELPTDGSAVITWCPRWWEHDAAVYRLTALWQAWEHMHVAEGPEAAARWLTYYADPIMDRLMQAGGVFEGCTTVRGHETHRPHTDARLPCAPAPAGLFPPRE